MRRRRAVAVLAVLAGLLAGCSSSGGSGGHPSTVGQGGAAPRCPAPSGRSTATGGLPDLRLACLGAGSAVDVARLAGPAVVNLWASWCYPCKHEMPLLQRAAEQAGQGVRVVGVNTNDEAGNAQRFVKKVGARYEQLSDPSGRLADALHAPGLPYTVAIDAAGAIVWHKAGVLAAPDISAAVHAAERGR